jgi:paraquat-inducible protein A
MARVEGSLIVCEECGLAHRWQPLGHGAVARCTRCDAVMARSHRLSIDAILALTVAAAAAYLVAINAPLLTLTLRGPTESASLRPSRPHGRTVSRSSPSSRRSPR